MPPAASNAVRGSPAGALSSAFGKRDSSFTRIPVGILCGLITLDLNWDETHRSMSRSIAGLCVDLAGPTLSRDPPVGLVLLGDCRGKLVVVDATLLERPTGVGHLEAE